MFSPSIFPPAAPTSALADASILVWWAWSPATLFVILIDVLFVVVGCALLWHLSRPQWSGRESPDRPTRVPEPVDSPEDRAA